MSEFKYSQPIDHASEAGQSSLKSKNLHKVESGTDSKTITFIQKDDLNKSPESQNQSFESFENKREEDMKGEADPLAPQNVDWQQQIMNAKEATIMAEIDKLEDPTEEQCFQIINDATKFVDDQLTQRIEEVKAIDYDEYHRQKNQEALEQQQLMDMEISEPLQIMKDTDMQTSQPNEIDQMRERNVALEQQNQEYRNQNLEQKQKIENLDNTVSNLDLENKEKIAEKDKEISKLQKEKEDFKKKIQTMDAAEKQQKESSAKAAKAQKSVRIKLPSKKDKEAKDDEIGFQSKKVQEDVQMMEEEKDDSDFEIGDLLEEPAQPKQKRGRQTKKVSISIESDKPKKVKPQTAKEKRAGRKSKSQDPESAAKSIIKKYGASKKSVDKTVRFDSNQNQTQILEIDAPDSKSKKKSQMSDLSQLIVDHKESKKAGNTQPTVARPKSTRSSRRNKAKK